MSLNMNGDRLLAEALKEAMQQDLADVPSGEELVRQHRFSRKFVRRMKRIQAGKMTADRQTDFRRLGAKAIRYSGLAALLACVISLAAVSDVIRDSASFGCGSAQKGITESAVDEAAPQESGELSEAAESAELEESSDTKESAAATEDALEDSGDSAVPESDTAEAGAGSAAPEAVAPDWQEQLLAESAKADEIACWRLANVYDYGTIELESGLVEGVFDEQISGSRYASISRVYEVYYEQAPDDWERVYHTAERETYRYEEGIQWGEGYSLSELNMTRTGSYRLVRQVNQYRQVLQLSLE